MITRCDQCGSTFEVSSALLNSSDPGVRCGECLSLFNARENLYNEADFLQASEKLKPVQRKGSGKFGAENMDAAFLETADTVAVEHTLTASGASSANTGDTGKAPPDFRPDIDLSSPDDSSPDDRHLRDTVDSRYPEDIEFERTVAHESAHAGTADTHYRESALPPRGHPARDRLLAGDSTEREARAKQQALREREQRALRMEPDRDFESQPADRYDSRVDPVRGFDQEQLRQVEQFRTESRTVHSRDNRTSSINDRDLDHAFIPDDVLAKPAVHRDNGRRGDDLQFSKDTPRFATSVHDHARRKARATADVSRTADENGSVTQTKRMDDRRHAGAGDQLRPGRDVDRRKTAPPRAERAPHQTAESRPSNDRPASDHPGNDHAVNDRTADNRINALHSSEFQHLYERPLPDEDEPAMRTGGPVVAGSSAQEMRRYQHYRPAVDVAVAPDVVDEPVTRRGSIFKPLLWFIGLCAVVCVLLYAARNLIANMDLPEPFISSFCQVTGCVPAEAQKDVSQLQTMRKALLPHPEIEDALVISVDVKNNSVYKQPLPTLAVTLLDEEGATIAERAFESADYEVVDGGENGFLMPREPTRLKIEVVNTGLDAAELELAFE